MTWKSIWYRAPALLYAAGLFWASGMSRLPLPYLGFDFQDKLLHGVAYLVFSLLIHLALARPAPVVRRRYLWSVILGVGYAITDELHQLFVPGREAEPADLAADVLGVVVGQLLIRAWKRRQSG